MSNEFPPGGEYAFVFDQPRQVQLARLAKQVEGLAVAPTADEALDSALSEIEFTIYVIRDAIFSAACGRNRAAGEPLRKSVTLNPDTIEDIA